ncbi:MAG: acetylornithine/N-succinyldiaminopimelate aminotransferase [Sphingobacteriales bacterium]|jgi:acetylornithine/N-succinyldiaminopimelate aminotransferase
MKETLRQRFKQVLAPTSEEPMGIEIAGSQGNYLLGPKGEKYLDLISGISVSNLGHQNERIKTAIKEQVDSYLHTMVYGEYIQSPQIKLAEKLTQHLPEELNSVYFVNSGSEAIEGAMKMAKKVTGKTDFVAFKNAYHGSTHGALSLMGSDYFTGGYGPFLPGITHADYNDPNSIDAITDKTAAVFVEPIQGEAGAIPSKIAFISALRRRTRETGTLLIFDEIQSGMGRTGKLFAFEHHGIVPDAITIAKAFGGGMPLGAFVSSQRNMEFLSKNPVLGHITTFGGHPVSCAAALASLEILTEHSLIRDVNYKESIFRKLLVHPKIKGISGKGLLLSLDLGTAAINHKVIDYCIANGVITDWFLFNEHSMRIAPPLTITNEEIEVACETILKGIATS